MADAEVVVLRAGTEGLSMASYARSLEDRLPEYQVRHARTPAEEAEYAQSARVITGIEPPIDVIESAPNLELFACTFAGVDHLPLDTLSELGVIVTNAGGIHAPGIAEQVIGYILTFARGLREGWARQQQREWRHYQARELNGSTVTVVGLGSIGLAVVDRLAGFGVDTIGVRYTPDKGGPTDEVLGYDPGRFHEALGRTDYLVIACPLTDTTEGLVDAAAFETLPPSSVVINVARGGVIETDALVDAIRSESIRGAALDVTTPEPLPSDHPLWTLDACIITPHMGGHTPQHWPRLAEIVAHNTRALANDQPNTLRNVVARP